MFFHHISNNSAVNVIEYRGALNLIVSWYNESLVWSSNLGVDNFRLIDNRLPSQGSDFLTGMDEKGLQLESF